MMRIAFADIKHEADTFSPVKTTIEDFENRYKLEGGEILEILKNTNTEVWGFARRMAELDQKVEVVPLFAASAGSGGSITGKTFEYLRRKLLHNVDTVGHVDGIYLSMHGAMVAEVPGGEDATGLLVKEVRKKAGLDVPIVLTLDLHANVTEQITENATVVIGYRTWPHIDQADRGSEAAEFLLRILEGDVKPVTSLCKLRMILPGENGQTTSGPMAGLLSHVRVIEAKGRCLSGSVFLVQPWMDIPDIGCSVVIVTNDDRETGQRFADQIGLEMWDKRHEFDVRLVPVEEAVYRAARAEGKPVVLADSADSTGSGATGDSTALLRGFLEAEVRCRTLLTMVDEQAVQILSDAGIGYTLKIQIGGKRDGISRPVEVEGEVEYLGRPSFRFSGPFQTGLELQMGRVSVLAVRDIHILLSERPLITVDPELYRAVGLEPTEAQIVVVKSPNLFRAAYEPIAHEIIVVDAPGLASPHIRALPFRRLQRPCYPFDEDWEGAPN